MSTASRAQCSPSSSAPGLQLHRARPARRLRLAVSGSRMSAGGRFEVDRRPSSRPPEGTSPLRPALAWCAIPRRESWSTSTLPKTARRCSPALAGLAPRASCQSRWTVPTDPVRAQSGSRFGIRPASRCSGSAARSGIGDVGSWSKHLGLKVILPTDNPLGREHC